MAKHYRKLALIREILAKRRHAADLINLTGTATAGICEDTREFKSSTIKELEEELGKCL